MYHSLRIFAAAFAAVVVGIHAFAGTTYYVSANGDGTSPTNGFPTGYSNIASAVSAATTDGDKIIIEASDTPYALAAAQSVSHAITIHGTDRDRTVIQPASGKSIQIFNITAAGAEISTLTLQGASVANGYGGNVEMTGDSVISNCVLRGGTAQNGSAISFKVGLVTHCIITNNTSTGGAVPQQGGAVMFNTVAAGTKAILDHCLVAFNRGLSPRDAPRGEAGISTYNFASTADARVQNCTIAFNRGTYTGGMYSNTKLIAVSNTLFYANRATTANDTSRDDFSGSYRSFVYCAGVDVPSGTGCLIGSGHFYRLEDPENGKFYPAAGTVAIGAAEDGSDIGCYQRPKTANLEVGGEILASALNVAVPFTVAFTNFTANAGAAGTRFAWNFGDGSAAVETDVPYVTHAYTAEGDYTPSVTATDKADPLRTASYSFGKCIFAAPVRIALTDADGGEGLRSGIARAGDGTEIVLAAGDYPVTAGEELAVEKGVTIRSASWNSADVTVYRQGTTKTTAHSVFYVNHKDALIAGLTITNGYFAAMYKYGGGAIIDGAGGTISNCVFKKNFVLSHRAAGSATYQYGGLVTHCLITDNRFCNSQYYNVKCGISYVHGGGTMRNCVVAKNYAWNNYKDGVSYYCSLAGVGIHDGTLESCTIVDNVSTGGVGGVWLRNANAVCRNCIIAGNQSVNGFTDFRAQWNGIGENTGNLTAPTVQMTYCLSDGDMTYGTESKTDTTLAFKNAAVNNYKPVSGDWKDWGMVRDWMNNATDYAGGKRLVKHIPDIGAYEAQTFGITIFVR